VISAIIREVAGCYLVFTLTATSLAKLWSWRTASTGLIAETIVPKFVALPTIIAVSMIELSLATFLAVGVHPVAVGCATAGVVLCFGGYKVAASAKSGNLSCSCAGTSRTAQATRSGVAGEVSASTAQAALACVWAFIPVDNGRAFQLPLIVALTIPFIVLLARLGWRRGPAHPTAEV
jgi:hypothetical protein